jgi:AcrR family transcriptional regulator
MDRSPMPANTAAVRAAVAIAREAGRWDAVRMQDVAQALGMPLAQLLRDCPDRDTLAECCFDVADQALLGLGGDPAWPHLDVRERLRRGVLGWLGALPDRQLVRGMLAYKFQPEHVHLQALGVMRISRTVQTLREVALLRATGWRREAEEAALTSIYLATFASWLLDGSAGARRTERRLARALNFAHRAGGWSG